MARRAWQTPEPGTALNDFILLFFFPALAQRMVPKPRVPANTMSRTREMPTIACDDSGITLTHA
jgi:hypothetical protein